MSDEDAEFIAHAPTDIDRLIRCLEKCIEQRDFYMRELKQSPGAFRRDDAELSRILGGEK